jgi:uncharacterized lipoprotein
MKAASMGPTLVAVALLAGCAAPAAVNYAPSSVLSAKGAVSVSSFRYLPAEKKAVQPNQIRNTAMGDVKIDRDVKDFVRDAVFAELRFVGVTLNDPRRTLTGEIVDFLIDDLGYSIDWLLKIRYVVAGPSGGAALYEAEKTSQKKTAKFVNPFGALNETIKLNVEELLKDPAFIKAIN